MCHGRKEGRKGAEGKRRIGTTTEERGPQGEVKEGQKPDKTREGAEAET
jgi:hypothetical protein